KREHSHSCHAPAGSEIKNERRRKYQTDQGGNEICGSSDSQRRSKNENTHLPHSCGSIQSMRHTDRGEDEPKDSPGHKNVRANPRAEQDYRRREAIKRKRGVSAFIAVESSRNPPERPTQPEPEKNEGKASQHTIGS